MIVENLISTVKNDDISSLLLNLNIQANSVITNQTNFDSFSEINYRNNEIKIFNVNDQGVGLSRNNNLMHSNADICIMTDDDMEYVDGYKDIVQAAYKLNPDADMIVFNVKIYENGCVRETVSSSGRVKKINSLRYGTATFTFKRRSIIENDIYFSLFFGGGAKYGSGEDSLFIWEVLSKGLNVYSCKDTIAKVYNDGSSWFTGYNDKFFYDKGALFAALSKQYWKILCIQFLIRKKRTLFKEINILKAYKQMKNGAKSYITNSQIAERR